MGSAEINETGWRGILRMDGKWEERMKGVKYKGVEQIKQNQAKEEILKANMKIHVFFLRLILMCQYIQNLFGAIFKARYFLMIQNHRYLEVILGSVKHHLDHNERLNCLEIQENKKT